MSETINHPSHYNSGKIEAIDIIEDAGYGTGFNLGNALKYILRCEHKGNKEEDLKKAVWYITRELGETEEPATVTILTQALKLACNEILCLERNSPWADDPARENELFEDFLFNAANIIKNQKEVD